MDKQQLNRTEDRTQCVVCMMLMCLLSVVSIVLACMFGSSGFSMSDFFHGFIAILNNEPTVSALIVMMRAQRIGAAFITGATLALAGILMQALLRNPLSDPYVLGISGGASVGALGMLFVGASFYAVHAGAFAGALLMTALLYFLCQRNFAQSQTSTLLLTGVILAMGCGAIVTLILTLADDQQLRGMVFWLVGDLSDAHLQPFSIVVLLFATVWAWRSSFALNLLGFSYDVAQSLGVNVAWFKKILFIICAVLTVSAVTCAGCIGFVGLIMPHATRLVVGSDHRLVVVCGTLAGGIFLVIADTLARMLISPMQLPVGVITSLIGVPCFLILLYRRQRL